MSSLAAMVPSKVGQRVIREGKRCSTELKSSREPNGGTGECVEHGDCVGRESLHGI